jgi:hypothetical protein
MPKGTRVHRCVDKLTAKGMPKSKAIPICQKSTHQSLMTGKSKTKAGKTVGGIKRRKKKG